MHTNPGNARRAPTVSVPVHTLEAVVAHLSGKDKLMTFSESDAHIGTQDGTTASLVSKGKLQLQAVGPIKAVRQSHVDQLIRQGQASGVALMQESAKRAMDRTRNPYS